MLMIVIIVVFIILIRKHVNQSHVKNVEFQDAPPPVVIMYAQHANKLDIMREIVLLIALIVNIPKEQGGMREKHALFCVIPVDK